MRVDTDALAEWSRTLDRMPPLADGLHPVESTSPPAGLSAAAMLNQANLDGLRALADVVASLDCLVDHLRAAAVEAAAKYALVDERSMSIVDSSVR